MTRRNLFLLLCSGVFLQSVAGDFGAYVDPDFTCPATTTCPSVCVPTLSACPSDLMVCGSSGNGTGQQYLCSNGDCVDFSFECPSTRNPCKYDCAPVACVKTIATLDVCYDTYGDEYDYEETCATVEKNARLAVHAPEMGIFYTWVLVASILTLVWCRLNHRAPLFQDQQDGSQSNLDMSGVEQTGFGTTLYGRILYTLITVTLWCFQALLLFFAIESYMSKHDQGNALLAFEITWVVGFLWSFSFKWPHSVQLLFSKRCVLLEATYVAVSAVSEPDDITQPSGPPPSFLRRLLSIFSGCLTYLMTTIFCDAPRKDVQLCPVQVDDMGTRYFVFNFRRYGFDSEAAKFVPGDFQVARTIADIVQSANGLTQEDVIRRRRTVGDNSIEMPKPHLWEIFVKEFSKPFYTYQNFMLWTWVPLNYFYMAFVHGSVIFTGGLTVAYFRYRNEANLYKLSHVEGEVQCKRNGKLMTVPQIDLVPGDIVVIQPGITYCDMALVQSSSVIHVDEANLTGESTPMAKTAVDPADGNKPYDRATLKKHTIYAGTTILETDQGHNTAVVVSTGSYTSKGELLRNVFSYKRHQFKFDTEVGFVITILFFYAIFGFATVIIFVRYSPVYAWFYGMFVVATCLPPLLPTVFTVSVGISENRLSRKRIACSNSEDILVAGKVTRAFFDKTGTLTKQGLDFISAKSHDTWKMESPDVSEELSLGMASCHGLSQSQAGDLIGNPVDRIMFEASGAAFNGTQGGSVMVTDRFQQQVSVVKHFDFDHHSMTQSVILKRADGSLIAYVKGSGESVKKICLPSSLPDDFDQVVRDSAKSGVYQISMASKVISSDGEGVDLSIMRRTEVESELNFIGVINFKNVLREETPNVIQHLEAGEVRCVMITGDNVLTGIRIAKESGMISPEKKVLACTVVDDNEAWLWVDEDEKETMLPSFDELKDPSCPYELAVSGEVWESMKTLEPETASQLVEIIRIFGRCTPAHKVSVVATSVNLGFITLMCGDGGNDCGALKTAHVGVALSDAEASVVSPFTSLDKSISSVVEILKEGRCALASALVSYKFIIIYGQIESMNQIINAYFHVNFSEWCWVFMDGFWVIGMSFTLPLAKAQDKLAPARPTSSLLGPHTMSSAIGVLFINYFWTILALVALFQQEWFQCRKWTNTDVSNLNIIGDNYEAQTVFIITANQYLSTAAAFNYGYEFRQAWYKNTWFVSLATFYTVIQIFVLLVPSQLACLWRINCENENVLYSIVQGRHVPIQNDWNTNLMPMSFRWVLLVIIVLNALSTSGWDYFVVNGTRKKLIAKRRGQSLEGMKTAETDLSDLV